MKSKLNGKLRYVAIGVFLLVLMFNVGITFTGSMGSASPSLNVDLEMLTRVEAQSEGGGSYNTFCVQDFIFICRICADSQYGYRERGDLRLCSN